METENLYFAEKENGGNVSEKANVMMADTETQRMVTMVTMTMSVTTLTPACSPFDCFCCCACYNILMLSEVTMVQIYEQNRTRSMGNLP